MNTLLIGFDIGGTKSAVVVGTDTGEIIDRQEWASDAWRGPQAMIEDCISAARIMYQNYPAIARAGVPDSELVWCFLGRFTQHRVV